MEMRTKSVFKQSCTGGVCFAWHEHFARLRAIFVNPLEISKGRRVSSLIPGLALQLDLNMLQMCCKKPKSTRSSSPTCSSHCSWCPCMCEIAKTLLKPSSRQKASNYSEQSGWAGALSCTPEVTVSPLQLLKL